MFPRQEFFKTSTLFLQQYKNTKKKGFKFLMSSFNREFKKLLRRRQRERHKKIGFNEINKEFARALN